jgi:hypothetical protein
MLDNKDGKTDPNIVGEKKIGPNEEDVEQVQEI